MYYALYRKWRPKVFSDVIGQQHIVTTLQNQVKNNKLSHAYLFTGFKGTGKTSCAKILAKAANCPNVKDGNPCNQCEICKGIDSGAIMDVLEIDAASNNGVENIRDLREEANFTPSVGKYRIYIIDEVHMLSIGAFNALLKIMEEPPSYVMFILATTEAHKVPATILSRCQQFGFNKIDKQAIVDRLLFIADAENVNLSKEAAEVIAKFSDGGLRDALSILDSCISYAINGDVDLKVVSKVISISDFSDILKLTTYIIEKDVKNSLLLLDELTSKTTDAANLTWQVIEAFRNILLIKTVDDTNCLDINSLYLKKLQELATKLDVSKILLIIDVLSNTYNKMPKVTAKQLELELAIIKITSQNNIQKVDNSIEKTNSNEQINSLKCKLHQLECEVTNLKNNNNHLATSSQNKKADYKLHNIDSTDGALYKEAVKIEKWAEILNILSTINPGLNAALATSKGYVNNQMEIVLVDTDNSFFLDLIRTSPQAKQTLKKAISQVLGKQYRIGPYKKTELEQPNDLLHDIEILAKQNGVNLEVEE